MPYAIPAPAVTTIPVVGGDPFPVRRIYCVGRNYAAHAREVGHDPDREDPFFFMKPAGAIVPTSSEVPYPPQTKDYQHEIELVVALAKGGSDIPVEKALDCVFGYAVGLDMTRRDLQGEAKKAGRPWEVGKAFDHAAPCSAIRRAGDIGHPGKGAIWLDVNGQRRQSGDLSDMIWSVPEIIAHLSGRFELKAGDLIFTGTPAGVAAVQRGDTIKGGIDGVGELTAKVG